jgi:arsenate reductase-like glutaredoxin family protein
MLLSSSTTVYAQTKPKEKPPTQKEMAEMMKEAQKMVDELSVEDKKIMDSLGIKMPGFKNIPNVSDKQLADAMDKEDRIVPKKMLPVLQNFQKPLALGKC